MAIDESMHAETAERDGAMAFDSSDHLEGDSQNVEPVCDLELDLFNASKQGVIAANPMASTVEPLLEPQCQGKDPRILSQLYTSQPMHSILLTRTQSMDPFWTTLCYCLRLWHSN